MGRVLGLYRRGKIWHYRRWVPVELRSQIGLSEITKSLHTADYSTAVQRCHTVSRDVEELFLKASQQPVTTDINTQKLLQEFATGHTGFKAPPAYDQDGLRTLIKTVVEEVVGRTFPVKKPSITLSELYRRYMPVTLCHTFLFDLQFVPAYTDLHE